MVSVCGISEVFWGFSRMRYGMAWAWATIIRQRLRCIDTYGACDTNGVGICRTMCNIAVT